jgi:CRISPR-associated protein Cmx8
MTDALEYNPLDPQLTVLHRAGIAGLLLQVKAMEKVLPDDLTSEQRTQLVPEYGFKEDGYTLWIKINGSSFQALMRERYQGGMVRRIYRSKKKESKPRRVFIEKTADNKFVYEEMRPLLRYLETFRAPEAWQEHIRESYWNSFFCIPLSQPIFQIYQPTETAKKADELWKALTRKKAVEIDKSLLPNVFKADLKGVGIEQRGDYALLLHFWPLVSTFFTPRNLKLDKDQKTGERKLVMEYQPPVIVVPDVIDVQIFTEDFETYLGALPESRQTRGGGEYLPQKYVSTPLEAPFAFFVAPRLAQHRVITPDNLGARGAEVYAFRRPARQAEVAAIFNEPLEDDLVTRYEMLQHIRSLPYRALCIENLLARPPRHWSDGFERLVAQYPLELFVATKSRGSSARQLGNFAREMAQSLCTDFELLGKENRMSHKDQTVEMLIWRITRNYVDWRARDKAKLADQDFKFDGKRLKELRDKQKNKQPLQLVEEQWRSKCTRYLNEVMDVTEDLFINFRARRDPQSFANAFSETLFRAPFYLSPEQSTKLRPFYEGEHWESGRRLVLMAISAAGAVAGFGTDEESSIPQDEETQGINSESEE